MSILLATALGLPWWSLLGAYAVVGIAFALFYLPRSIGRQVETYRSLRQDTFAGVPIEKAFCLAVEHMAEVGHLDRGMVDPEKYLPLLQAPRYQLAQIGEYFMLHAALWPVMLPYLMITDILQSFFRWVGDLLRSLWLKVLRPIYRAIFNQVAEVYRWIISWANREALADAEQLAALKARHGGAQ